MTDDRWAAFLDRMHAAGWYEASAPYTLHILGDVTMFSHALTGAVYWSDGKMGKARDRSASPWTEYADAGTTPAPF